MQRFQRYLTTKSLGRTFIGLHSVSSTMDVASQQIEKGCPHGTVIFAEEQTKAQARVEKRQWSSSQGNISATVILHVKFEHFPRILPASSLAVVKACLEEGAQAKIKWPNDVFVEKKKLCGMIARSDGQGICQLGIGMNVNQDMSLHPTLQNTAISLSQACQRPIEREKLLASYLNHLEPLLYEQDPVQLHEEYSRHSLFAPGEEILVHKDGLENPGVVATVVGYEKQFFQLIVRDYPHKGDVKELNPEEVSIRRTQ